MVIGKTAMESASKTAMRVLVSRKADRSFSSIFYVSWAQPYDKTWLPHGGDRGYGFHPL